MKVTCKAANKTLDGQPLEGSAKSDVSVVSTADFGKEVTKTTYITVDNNANSMKDNMVITGAKNNMNTYINSSYLSNAYEIHFVRDAESMTYENAKIIVTGEELKYLKFETNDICGY